MAEKLVRVELRMETSLVDKLDLWAEQHGFAHSRAEAIRTMIENSIDQNLSYGDKLNLYMGLKIIKQSCKDEYYIKQIDNALKAIEDGHDWALNDQLFSNITKNSDDPKSVHFVFSVLPMFDDIQRTFRKLDKNDRNFIEKNIGREPLFDGFDGNEEFNLMSIAEYILVNLNRYEGVFNVSELNSHCNREDVYKRMLEKYNSKNKYHLSKEDIVDIFSK